MITHSRQSAAIAIEDPPMLVRTTVTVERVLNPRNAFVLLPNGKRVFGFIDPRNGEFAPQLAEEATMSAELNVADFSRARLIAVC
ncbi:MAG: hypothetical protein KDK97_18565 [Verrucomicrobiales bacterium]|nr:hypothetical protein [Verrucomicrobiales bacterium]MCP5558383.1 hypothetical protein [Verrucomicrobiaceae bacterium]